MSNAGDAPGAPRVPGAPCAPNALIMSRQVHQSASDTCLCATHREVHLAHSVRDNVVCFSIFSNILNKSWFSESKVHFSHILLTRNLCSRILTSSLLHSYLSNTYFRTNSYFQTHIHTHISIDLQASQLMIARLEGCYSLRPKPHRYTPEGPWINSLIFCIEFTDYFFHDADL